jgi:hypothetical protein
MTPDERNLLSTFLRDLAQARASGKDAEADRMIKDAFAANPDAAYLIVQHAILSDQALRDAQQRIADLQAGRGGSGFLGGQSQSTSVPPSAPYPQSASYAQPSYQPSYQPGASPFSSGGGLGSFLRSAGTMAAGVAAGDFLFEGLSGLFGGHRGFGFGGPWGGGYGGGFGGPAVENVTINEYDNGPRDGGFRDSDDGFRDDSGQWVDDSGGGWDDNS